MKFLNRLLLASLAVIFAMSLCVTAATAQTSSSKKKKKAAVAAEIKAEKKAEKKAERKKIISGTNLDGRAGLFFADTSDVAPVGQWQGSLHATWSSPAASFNSFSFPLGAHYGAAPNVDLSAGVRLDLLSEPSYTIGGYDGIPQQTLGGSSTDFTVLLGGKYKIAANSKDMPDFSVGGIIYIPTYTGGDVVFMPKGTVTYVLPSGLLLNGDFGIGISSATYVECDGGVGFPVSRQVTLIGEIGANQYGNADSQLALGARFDLSGTKLQALLGVPLNGGGVLLGAGIILASN